MTDTGDGQGGVAILESMLHPTNQPSPMFTCGQPINTGPAHYVLDAAFDALDRWVARGVQPSVAPRLQTTGSSPVTFATDAAGNVKGGIRTPAVDVPVATLSGLGQDGSSFLPVRHDPASSSDLHDLQTTRTSWPPGGRDKSRSGPGSSPCRCQGDRRRRTHRSSGAIERDRGSPAHHHRKILRVDGESPGWGVSPGCGWSRVALSTCPSATRGIMVRHRPHRSHHLDRVAFWPGSGRRPQAQLPRLLPAQPPVLPAVAIASWPTIARQVRSSGSTLTVRAAPPPEGGRQGLRAGRGRSLEPPSRVMPGSAGACRRFRSGRPRGNSVTCRN